jgi:NAD-dependent dihydropyrimidine dehydrogenase PreA subunit
MGLWDSLGLGRKAEAPAGTAGEGGAGAPSAPRGAEGASAANGPPSWAPRIDANACRGCGTCLDECPEGVFFMGRHDGKARVTSPEDCRASCDRCATHCPEKGIRFPGRAAGGVRS